jgi:hypothetical protein
LARDALRGFKRNDLVLELCYAPEAADRVRELVRREEVCCAFLAFDVRETPTEVLLTIRAPEEARAALDIVFGQFTGGGFLSSAAAYVLAVAAQIRRCFPFRARRARSHETRNTPPL